eukprot:369772_1
MACFPVWKPSIKAWSRRCDDHPHQSSRVGAIPDDASRVPCAFPKGLADLFTAMSGCVLYSLSADLELVKIGVFALEDKRAVFWPVVNIREKLGMRGFLTPPCISGFVKVPSGEFVSVACCGHVTKPLGPDELTLLQKALLKPDFASSDEGKELAKIKDGEIFRMDRAMSMCGMACSEVQSRDICTDWE